MDRQLIVVDDVSTYPEEFSDLVSKYSDRLATCFEGCDIQESSDIRCAFDPHAFFNDPTMTAFQREAEEVLKHRYICVYHNTRLVDPSSVIQNGLFVLEPERYVADLKATLSNGPFREQATTLVDAVLPFIQNERGVRTGLLAFYAPYAEFEEYSKFSVNVGGEIAEYAFYNNEEVLSFLSQIGEPVTVEFAVAFSDISDYRQDVVLCELVRKYYTNIELKFEYQIRLEATTQKNIPPEDILRIMPVN